MAHHHSHTNIVSSSPSSARRLTRSLAAALLTCAALGSVPACSKSVPEANAPQSTATPQQRIVERSAAAFEDLRKDVRHARMNDYLRQAKGVLIFPRLVKASFVFGGEGGNGVLVARKSGGGWSSPAFYSIGSPSVGLQIGYQQATVVLFIMNDATLKRAMDASFSLGAKAGVSVGDADEVGTRGSVMTADIYQVVDAEGAYAGASLDGYVIGARDRHNHAYYGKAVAPRDILLGNGVQKTDALVLERALAPVTTTQPPKSAAL